MSSTTPKKQQTKGSSRRSLPRYPTILLSQSEELALFEQYKQGSVEAFQALVNSQIKLVLSQVLRITRRVDYCDASDLLAEGILGVCTAVRKFDPTQGIRLSTYAGIWSYKNIRAAITLEASHRKHTVPSLSAGSSDLENVDIESLAVHELERTEQQLYLSELWSQLPSILPDERERNVFLRRVEGATLEEIATEGGARHSVEAHRLFRQALARIKAS